MEYLVDSEQFTAAVDNDFWDFPDMNWGSELDLVDVPLIEAINNYGEVYNPLENAGLESTNRIDRPKRGPKKKLSGITYVHLEPYFEHPISNVAEVFGVAVATLRARCRELGIPSWPCTKENGVRRPSMPPHIGPAATMGVPETSFVDSMASGTRSPETLFLTELERIKALLMQDSDEMEYQDFDGTGYQDMEALLYQHIDGIRPLVLQDSDELQYQDGEYPNKFLFVPPITEEQPIIHDEMDEFLFNNIDFEDDITSSMKRD